tara:strand:- start:552 stop:1217 length:666 start_codon:yes stop_codon:yes gene_type:complete
MKKEILSILMLLGLCFSQTGMMTDKGESGFGIWVETNGDVECEYSYLTGNEYCDQATVLSLDYMFSFGLEIGVDYGIFEDETTIVFQDGGYDDYTEEYDITGASVSYHIKSYDGGNFFLSYKKHEMTLEDSEPLREAVSASLGFYGKKKSFFELIQETITVNGYEYDPNEYVNFGGVIKFGKGGLLIGYKIDTEAVEMAFDEEDFDYLKYGQLTLSLGGVF